MQSRRAPWTAAAAAVAAMAATYATAQPVTERTSVSSTGEQATGGRYTPRPAVSGDGLTVAFESPVATLVPGDTNLVSDIFIESGGSVSRVLGNGSAQPNCGSLRASVSANGQFVAFDSCATNLVPGDTNNASDVFVLDTTSGVVTRVSVASDESQGSGASFASRISPNGQFVAFISQAPNMAAGGTTSPHVYLRDLVNGNTFLVSRASGVSGTVATSEVRPSVADDGTVAFVSASSSLLPVGQDTNGVSDVFLRLSPTSGTPTTVRVSLTAAGGQLGAASTRPSISADGQLVVFDTAAAAVASDTNGITDVYVRDRTAATTVLVSRTAAGNGGNGNSYDAAISPTGSFVAFTSQAADLAGSFDAAQDVFRASLVGSPVAVGGIDRISNASAPTADSGSASVASAGRVVFSSDEPTLVAGDDNGDTDVFSGEGGSEPVQRLTVTATGLPATYSGTSLRPAPSYDGSLVAFLSLASNLVPGDTNTRVDVFLRNRTAGTTERLPIPTGYESLDADWVTISHDGRFIAYTRGNLGQGTGAAFLHDRFTGVTTPVSVAAAGGTPRPAAQPRVSASGRYVTYLTSASFDAADTNGLIDVYLFDRLTGVSTLVSRATAGTANGASTGPTVSADGRLVAFVSIASNLVAGDLNGRPDVFVRDMVAGTTTRLSVNVDAQPGTIEARDAFISADGAFVTYLLSSTILTSEATAASDVYVIRSDGSGLRGPLNTTTEGSGSPPQGSYDPTLSMFGRFLAFRSYAPGLVPGDSNGAADVFGRQILGNVVSGTPATAFTPAERLSVDSAGGQASGGTGFDTENPEVAGAGTSVVYQSGFTTLVTGDTNGMVDTFIRAGLFANGECAYIEQTLPGYTAYISQYGLDPCSNSGSPFADPDGDGATNDQERTAPGGPTDPVLGAFTRYFAEGATKTGGLNFDVRLALANPSALPVSVQITYQLPSGIAVQPTDVTLQPYERRTVLLDEQPGIDEDGPDPAYEFSTTVRASAPIGVDRLMTWDKSLYAGHAETGVVSPSRTWYFAEGATIGGFNLFYLLQNPSNANVTVEGRYLLGSGAVYTKTYTLLPNSRTNVWANVEQIDNGTPLESAEFSAAFTVTSGAPIIAERAMYRGANPVFKAGHESAGITEPATEWFLAEGNAGDFFDHFVLIGNTTSFAAFVQADFIVGNTGTVYTRQYTVSPNSRFNIWVDEEEVLPGQFPFRTGNTDVSVRIRSLNGVPLIVERAMWWPGSSNTWYEAHNSPGSSRTASRWVVAEGENGGGTGWQTYILVANTGDSAGSLRIRLLLPNGNTAVLTGQPVAARSRTTYFLGDLLQAAGLPTDTQAGVLIEAEGESLPLVVERAMYRNANGITFQVGTNALGTPLP